MAPVSGAICQSEYLLSRFSAADALGDFEMVSKSALRIRSVCSASKFFCFLAFFHQLKATMITTTTQTATIIMGSGDFVTVMMRSPAFSKAVENISSSSKSE